MPTYVVTGPDGKKYRVTAPEGATEADVMARVRGQSSPKQVNPIANVIAGGIEGAAGIPDAVTEAIAGGMRYAVRPAAKLGSAFYRGIGLPGAAQRVDNNARQFDQALSRPATVARGVQAVVPVPRDTTGKIVRFGAQMVGGAAVPLGARATPSARFPRPAAPRKNAPNFDVIRAGERQKIPVRRPDARPDLRGDMATAEASQYAGGHVARTLEADKAALQARLGEIGGPGNVQVERYNLGEQLQATGKDFIKKSRDFFKENYRKVDELNRGGRIMPNRAVAQIDQDIAELSAAPNTHGETISYLRGLRDDMMAAKNGFTASEFQALRSANRGKIRGNQALTFTDAERRLGNAVDAFSADAQAQMTPTANQLLGITDKAYAARMDFIGNMLQPHVLGRRNAPMASEKAADNMLALAKNRANYDRLRQFWNIAPENVQQDFAATLTDNLGKRGDRFGYGTLATDIDNVPANVRGMVYGDRAPDLADLQTLARAKGDTITGLNNSRSAVVMARQVGKRALPSLAGGYLVGGPFGAVMAPALTEGIAAAGQMRAASKLLNPNWASDLAPAAAQAPSLLNTASPYILQGAAIRAANDADQFGGLLGQRFIPSLAASDERERKKKKNQR